MRKGLTVGVLVVLEGPTVPPSVKGHAAMAKGIETVIGELMTSAGHSGTPVVRFGPQY
jgi:hypothetical protein